MPKMDTTDFGTVEYGSDEPYTFPSGLPGFPQETRFLLLERDPWKPFVFLQSLRDAGLRFITIPVDLVEASYRLDLEPQEGDLLGESGLLCLGIVTFRDESTPTVNLLAPVVLSPGRRVGVQSIQNDSGYSHEYPLRPEAPC
jgi:flagellar assembly factor FliW